MNEEHPEFIPFIPEKGEDETDTPARVDIDSALQQFEQYRNRQLILLENADSGIWQRTASPRSTISIPSTF